MQENFGTGIFFLVYFGYLEFDLLKKYNCQNVGPEWPSVKILPFLKSSKKTKIDIILNYDT